MAKPLKTPKRDVKGEIDQGREKVSSEQKCTDKNGIVV